MADNETLKEIENTFSGTLVEICQQMLSKAQELILKIHIE